MQLGICSFSFHRTFAKGDMDLAGYIDVCRQLGCTQLDPWNAHLSEAASREEAYHAGTHPGEGTLAPPGKKFCQDTRTTCEKAGLPVGLIAVDAAHICEEDPAVRAENRQRAYGWLDAASWLGAKAVRIDAGGPEDMPADAFDEICRGYADLLPRAGALGLKVLIENHWGPSRDPDNLQRILDACAPLGYLLDSNNWAPGRQEEGWSRFASRADAIHVKTYVFDDKGDETTVDLGPFFAAMASAGFDGWWGVESVPRDGDEIAGARKTIELIRRHAG
jgi:sugar phosphate isomerase/epimerase